jgi:hypothetical protein
MDQISFIEIIWCQLTYVCIFLSNPLDLSYFYLPNLYPFDYPEHTLKVFPYYTLILYIDEISSIARQPCFYLFRDTLYYLFTHNTGNMGITQ